MTSTLESLASCFQGLLPAQLLHLLARRHPRTRRISVTSTTSTRRTSRCRFSSSTRAGATSPRTRTRWCIVIDPDTGQGWRLRLRYVRSETVGPAVRSDGAAHRGDRVVLRTERHLQAAAPPTSTKCCAVEPARETNRRAHAAAASIAASGRGADPVFTMQALQDRRAADPARRLARAALDSILEGLERELRLQAFDDPRAVAEEPACWSRSPAAAMPQNGVGAEVRFGEGIAGVVAEARKPIRISGLMREMLYALRRAQARARSRDSSPGGASPARTGQSREPARRAAARARRARRRAVHRERTALSLSRGRQGVDRAARQLPGDRDSEHAAAGAAPRRVRAPHQAAPAVPAAASRPCAPPGA